MAPAQLLARIGVTALGAAIVAIGIALLVLPGPGLLVVALGLAILSWEYPAVRRLARPIEARAMASARVAAADPVRYAGMLIVGAGMVALGILWGAWDALPFSHPVTGASVAIAGAVLLSTSIWARRTRGAPQPQGRQPDRRDEARRPPDRLA